MPPETYCPGCGAPRAVGARFCASCGRPLDADPTTLAAAPSLAPVVTSPPVTRQRTSPVLILAVILTGLLALGAIGYAVSQPGGLVAVATATPTASPTATPFEAPVVTDEPIFTEPPPAGGLNLTAALGEAVALQNTDTGKSLGAVTVVRSKKYTSFDYSVADKGKTFVGVDVKYNAVSGFDYNPFDWVAHDASGTQYEYDGSNLNPALGSGTLAAGRHKEGWISFQVPKTLAHLWVDYENSDGTVVFSVKLY
jgi:hypothetical protein